MYCSNHIFLFTFPISKELYIFLKKEDDHGFLSYTKHYISLKPLSTYLDWGWSKIWLFLIKSCNSKHFSQNLMMPCYWYYFSIFYIYHFFQMIMFSLFLAWHDQCFIIFKDSNVFKLANFPLKTKYNNTVYSTNSNYLFSKGKQEK